MAVLRYRRFFRMQVIIATFAILFVAETICQDCGTPPYLLNGAYTLPSGTLLGAVAEYTCTFGYGIVGSTTVQCLNTGVWDTLPVCSKDCGTPISIENGNFAPPSNTLKDGEGVYSCNPGYSMIGSAVVVCQSSGRWTSAPGCQLVPTAFSQSCFISEQCTTKGATCRSDDLGDTKCQCAATGEIYDASLDSCFADCGSLSNPTNGIVTLPEKTSEEQIAVYKCNVGFTLSDMTLAIRTCLSTGDWSMAAPECIVGCVNPPPPKHGYVNVSNNRAAGDTITYGCDSGYMLVGVKTRVCRDDTTWSGNEPLCLLECPVLAAVEDGSVDISNGYWEGSIANYVCDKDYALVGTSTRTCQSTGEWNGFPPICVFAILPDVLLVVSCLLIVVVIINLLTVAFFFYFNNKKRTWNSIPSVETSETFDDEP